MNKYMSKLSTAVLVMAILSPSVALADENVETVTTEPATENVQGGALESQQSIPMTPLAPADTTEGNETEIPAEPWATVVVTHKYGDGALIPDITEIINVDSSGTYLTTPKENGKFHLVSIDGEPTGTITEQGKVVNVTYIYSQSDIPEEPTPPVEVPDGGDNGGTTEPLPEPEPEPTPTDPVEPSNPSKPSEPSKPDETKDIPKVPSKPTSSTEKKNLIVETKKNEDKSESKDKIKPLVAKAKAEETKKETKKEDKKELPKTGSENNVWLTIVGIGALLASLAGAYAVMKSNKK